MKNFVALLLSTSIAVAGCASASSQESATLLAWTRDAGLASVVQGISESITETADGLKGLGSSATDVATMVQVLRKTGDALASQADALAAEPASSDAQYEEQRSSLVNAMRSFRETTTDLKATDLKGITTAIQALTEISNALAALNGYIEQHGEDPVTAA